MIIEPENKKNRGLTLFLIAFFISSFFSVAINSFGKNVEDYFLFREIAKNPQFFTAQVIFRKPAPAKEEVKEETKLENKNLELSAKSVISLLFNPDSKEEKIIFEKERDLVLPIASLTKLMVVDVVLENYNLNQTVKISESAVSQEEDIGNLKVGEELSVENLLYIMLIESSNDAAYALTELITPKDFVDLMNLEAKYIGMTNTHFEDSMGISEKNQSNTKDLVILIEHLLEKPLIWDILRKPEFELKLSDGILHHKLINTNEILREWGSNLEIVGGKTGYTNQANGCFILVLKVTDDGYLINVILGSNDRFGEMTQLINFLKEDARLSY
jgi:D-alanyl-D-alanine carboxypeptidase